ncbi:mavicyanin-like [Cynara cardunculus var. scolymus]|uniref:Cupredoxin n=1 Tax=Cynara cardunculus var. scolymus TaxID=59895 RepID=A0A103YIG8_CYNCS|nr:mavicyanin-like [Cynara cardunculus var. scolymus]KVI09637.1 Cupredoxin [Cynara cardunculus var. scolymus]
MHSLLPWMRRPMVAHCRHRFSKTAILVPLALILVLFTAVVGGKKHIVGGSIWSIPPSKNFYNNWSSSQSFHPGDILHFEFESQMYNVLQVSYGQYARCEWEYPENIYSDGPALVSLTKTGELYFTCSIFNYCLLGLKMIVDVTPSPPPPQP